MAYTWYNEEKTLIQKDNGEIFAVATETEAGCRAWLEYNASGETPSDYVAPTVVELTPQQKLERAGLSVDELKGLLGI